MWEFLFNSNRDVWVIDGFFYGFPPNLMIINFDRKGVTLNFFN
jgi:hypothetical protein